MNSDQQYKFAKKYKEINLKSADGGNLIITIYEEIISFLEQSHVLLDEKSYKVYDKISTLLTKAQALIVELMLALNKDANESLHENLSNLYLYFYNEIREANYNKDSKKIVPLIDLLKELLEAWKEAVKTTKSSTKKPSGLNISL